MLIVMLAALAEVGFGFGGECASEGYATNATALLQLHTSKVEGRWDVSGQPSVPNMFVAVMIDRASSVEQRKVLRELWHNVDNGTGEICMRFAVCMQANDHHEDGLVAEHKKHDDMLFLDCAEGYGEGLLTKKLIKIMHAYREAKGRHHACFARKLFMKTDADTFVSGHQLRESISTAVAEHGHEVLFGGVMKGPVDVKRAGFWNEPCENWANSTFPPSMEGGPGYVLGRSLVERIIDKKIPEHHFLWNEDKAVGVWIDLLQHTGAHVDWFEIPGTSGFDWDEPVKSGNLGAYPYALHHHLSRACIACLAQLDRMSDNNAYIDGCFDLEPLPERDFSANWELEQKALPCKATT
jgi:hypothetical protein